MGYTSHSQREANVPLMGPGKIVMGSKVQNRFLIFLVLHRTVKLFLSRGKQTTLILSLAKSIPPTKHIV